MPYNLIIFAVLILGLGGALYGLEQSYKANGKLEATITEQQAAIQRLSKAAIEREAEAAKLSTLLAEREVALHESRKMAAAAKDSVRVVVRDDPDLSHCDRLHWPADVVRWLRENARDRGPDGKAAATRTPVAALSAPRDTDPAVYRY